jgi:hypothetical protein
MTVLESLAILEAAVLECKKRNVNTPEVSTALDLLERYIYPKWLIPQFRNHMQRERNRNHGWELEGLQQVLRATFPRIRDCVRELLGVRMDRLALRFHETKDMAAHDEIYRLARELSKLDGPWKFESR